jgi:hypothetical protein
MALAELHYDVEEVHAVELELLAEPHIIVKLRQVLIRSDVAKDVQYFFSNLGSIHAGVLPDFQTFTNFAARKSTKG